MVSSTFYDLKQVRTDLAEFINELGFTPLLSELPSFPIEPDLDTTENCRRRVQHEADAMVLVIGGRYGSLDSKTAKSITNLEYLAARAKGIPIFAFVEKPVLALLPIWDRNPDVDFSATVDDPRLFTFIQQLRSEHAVWTFEFERVAEIITVLRQQFAYLVTEALDWRSKLSADHERRFLASLQGPALRLALERPTAWEYQLFSQVLADELAASWQLRREYDLQLSLGFVDHVALSDVHSWMAARLAELQALATGLDTLVNHALQQAFGAPGEPGVPEDIVFVARRIGTIYRCAIEWAQKVRSASIDNPLRPVLTEMSEFSRTMIERTEDFSARLFRELREALSQPSSEPTVLHLTLTLDLYNLDRFEAALEAAQTELI